MLRTAVIFSVLCGLLGEALEVLHFGAGGATPPDWRLRGTLMVAYAAIALLLFGGAAVITRSRRTTLVWATVGFAVLLVVPWLNVEYLPRLTSVRSLVGSAVAVAVLALLAPQLVRFRRLSAAGVALVALVANYGGLPRAAGPPRGAPVTGAAGSAVNVVVILIDTLRADRLGAYGYGRGTSPNFDRLAEDGVLFERVVAQAAWTKPSVASLLTGTFVHKHGVMRSRDALGGQLPTLAEKLRERGYRTAAFSGNPWITPEFRFDRGFDQFESGQAIGVQLTNLYRLLKRADRAFRMAGAKLELADWLSWAATEGNRSNSARDAAMTEAVIEWLGRNEREPFFLYVHLIGPHDPYDPPPEYVRAFRSAAGSVLPRTAPPPRVQSIFERAAALGGEELASLTARYDGAVAYTDFLLGRIVGALEDLNIADDTVLVVTSDHGEEFYEHGNWRHGNQLYDEVIRVPLVIRWPGRLRPQRRTQPAMLIDVFPTILAAVGAGQDLPHLDGQTLLAERGEEAVAAFSEHWWFEGGTYVSRMVLRGGLKLKETRDEARGQERFELYDLVADAREQRNLLGEDDALGGNGAGKLELLLAEFGGVDPVASAPSVDVDRSTAERLRALGY